MNYQVTPLPKPADRPGESFEYETRTGKPFRIWNLSTPSRDTDKDRDRVWNPELPPSAIWRFSEAAVPLLDLCYAFGFHQAFRQGETRIKVRAAQTLTGEGADPSRAPSLTVAIGSTNFHGVELRTLGESIVIDHADYRTYEFRVRMENVSIPNTRPLNDKNAALVAAWNSARQVTNEAQPPRLKIEWIEFESPYFEAWPTTTHTNLLFAKVELDEPAYAREVVRRFAARAYRAPVAPAELDRLMNYWTRARASADTLEDSLRDTLGVVLTSPRFLALPAIRTGRASEREHSDGVLRR